MPTMISSGRVIAFFSVLAVCTSCSDQSPEKLNYGVIPAVSELDILGGATQVDKRWAILPTGNVEDQADDLKRFFQNQLGIEIEYREIPSRTIYLLEFPEKKFGPEGYHLEVRKNKVVLESANPVGMARGIATLKQLILLNKHRGQWFIPNLEIRDSAAFAHRGMLLDCCRHFFSVDVVKKYIDLLALFKMNTLHWHLTEDQGWRIEIDKYPKLTETGAFRTEQDGTNYGGFYTKEEIREIVDYASKRQIEVIPEIELPGHSQAAIASYPHLSCTGNSVPVANDWGVFKEIYCAGNDSVFVFLEDVLTEVMELFPSKKIHIGGDEAPKTRWEACSKCQKRMRDEGLESEAELQSYFIKRIQSFLKENDRELIGWDEIIEGGLAEGAIVQSWRGMDGGVEAVKHGRQAIMSPTSHAYFDYDLKSIDLEKVYSFYPIPEGLSTSEAELILGGECNMWSERVPDEATLDSKVFPRLLAMSEVLWSDSTGRDFSEFQNRVESMYSVLDVYKVNYGREAVPFTHEVSLDGQNTSVILNPYSKRVELKYRKDCPQCDTISATYGEPIEIDGDFDLVVESFKGEQAYGAPITIPFESHLAINANVSYLSDFSEWYTAGGEKGLVDSKLGTLDFRDGSWQGFWGDDLKCVLNLGEDKWISEVSANFYQYGNSWIFMPKRLEVEVSQDGKTWNVLGTARPKTKPELRGKHVEKLSIQPGNPLQARYLKLKAKNLGTVPDWHVAAGSEAWIFIDEIIVE